MLQQQLEQQQQQELFLQQTQARQREAGTQPAPVPGRQPPLLTGSLGARTLPSEIEEVEDCASSGSFVGSSLSSTFLATSASTNALSSMGQHRSIRREAPMRVYRVSRVGPESAPQVHGPGAQQQQQQQQQQQLQQRLQLEKENAEAKDLCMRRSASGPALAVLSQQQDQFRRSGAGGTPPVPSPALAVPVQGSNSNQEGDGDLGFHSPRGMSKGTLSDRLEGEKGWVGGKEADEARQQGKGSLTFSFLGALLGGRSSTQQSTPDGTVHEGGSGVPLPHHHYRNPAHTSSHAALIIGSPTPPVSSVLGRASGSFFRKPPPPLGLSKPPIPSPPPNPPNTPLPSQTGSPATISLGASPIPSRPMTPAPPGGLLSTQPPQPATSHQHQLGNPPADAHQDFRRTGSGLGEAPGGLRAAHSGPSQLPSQQQQQQQQQQRQQVMPGKPGLIPQHSHRQQASACHSGFRPPTTHSDLTQPGGSASTSGPSTAPPTMQTPLLPYVGPTPMQLMHAAGHITTPRGSVHGGDAYNTSARASQAGEGGSVHGSGQGSVHSSVHGGSSTYAYRPPSSSVHGGSQFCRVPSVGVGSAPHRNSLAGMVGLRLLQQQQQQQQQRQQQRQQQPRGASSSSSKQDDGFLSPKNMSNAMPTGRGKVSPQDIAVLASSLPSSFCYPRGSLGWMTREDKSEGGGLQGLVAAEDVSVRAGSAFMGARPALGNRPSLSRRQSVASGLGDLPEGAEAECTFGKVQPPMPICLICLEMLMPEDFESGEAIVLECMCKGELAMRHRACAIEWSNFKGDLTCDICKHEIRNLPPIDPAILAAREEARRRRMPNFNTSPQATWVDFLFDGIRVAWLVVIFCILFRPAYPINQTFILGGAMGALYVALSLLLNCITRTWRARRQRRQEEQLAAEAAAHAAADAQLHSITTEALTQAAAAAAAAQRSVRGGQAALENEEGVYTLTEPLLIPGSADNV